MQLHLSEDTGKVLYCQICERELIPAYWSEDGLQVGYWYDFEPADGQVGLLVCGDFDCEYEEAVTFTSDTTDSVVLNMEWTLIQWEENLDSDLSEVEALKLTAEMEEVYAQTGRAKLDCAVQYFRQQAESQRKLVEKWLVEAAKGFAVDFYVDDDHIEGQVMASNEDSVVVQCIDGQVKSVQKGDVYHQRIVYPRKETKPWRHGDRLIHLRNPAHIVVNNYHLRYQDVTEYGYHTGSTRDPAVAAALRLPEVSPGFYSGTFRAEEIERYYWRRYHVKFQGYWLDDCGRSMDKDFVWVKTKDPEVAKALDMSPSYAMDANEFGGMDGDLIWYDECLPVAEIEETSWDEEVQPLPVR